MCPIWQYVKVALVYLNSSMKTKLRIFDYSKGQLISNAVNSSKKLNEWMNSFLLVCNVFLFIFWKKWNTPKRHFEIIWPLDIENWLWKSEFCCFRPSILKRSKGQKYFHSRFCRSLALPINHYTQKFPLLTSYLGCVCF